MTPLMPDSNRPFNSARFFVNNRHVAWVLLLAVVFWGVFAVIEMPKRKDPEIPVRVAVAVCPWPGASAEKMEQLVTRKLEEKISGNAKVEKIISNTRAGATVVYVILDEDIVEMGKEFDDIKGKLDGIQDLPEGAGPIDFIKDFGDTATVMLTVASPKAGEVEIALRAERIGEAVRKARDLAGHRGDGRAVTLVFNFPISINTRIIRPTMEIFARFANQDGFLSDGRVLEGSGFIGLDGLTEKTDGELRAYGERFIRERLHASEFHPDSWPPVLIRDPMAAREILARSAGDKYTYRELDDFTDLIQKTLHTVPEVSKVTRHGILPERIFLEYSQERLAAYGLQPGKIRDLLYARNITLPGGIFEATGRNLSIDPSGEFKSEREIGDVIIAATAQGAPVYLRDLVDILRGYENPARFLNFYTWRDGSGAWQRNRAVTLAVQMRPDEKVDAFGRAVDGMLENLKRRLPEDLILAKTSDQPLQVKENVDLFMKSLYEAIALVVLIAFIGFWEWRSALLLAAAIPLTLAMTFGMMHLLGLDLQQVSIGSLILSLGLLVDVPVVAGDAIKRELAAGTPALTAAWTGPTKLARAMFFATVTNIVAYLPFLILKGDIGRFLYTLPVVLTCALVCSWIVSLTFTPLLSFHLLRKGRKREPSMEERRTSGFTGLYFRVGGFAIANRWKVLAASLTFLVLGGFLFSHLKTQFFPKDTNALSYVDVWLPEDATLSETNAVAVRAEAAIQRATERPGGENRLRSITSFIGGGGPRFWLAAQPEQQQLHYAQLILQMYDKRDTERLADAIQDVLSREIAGARLDVRQLENAEPVGIPVSVRLSGEDIPTLREFAGKLKEIFRSIPEAERIRDNWGAESFAVRLRVDPDRANLAGVSNLDVALSSVAGMSGFPVSVLREGNRQIPILVRLRQQERAQLSDIENLYVYSLEGNQKVPLRQVSTIDYAMETGTIMRRNQFRTFTVSCFPIPGVLPSQVIKKAAPMLNELAGTLPPGYRLEIGGEQEEQIKGFRQLTLVMIISIFAIFIALVIQFRNAVKPFIVFAAIPYGMAGAVIALAVMGTSFGFMAFLGVISLIGVIISHIIVLFDFIEEMHRKGEPLQQALLDAGIVRLRPVMITVAATVFALFPLAIHGGTLWQPLCFAQIGGLTVATFITLLLVPVLYAIAVLDLGIVKWEERSGGNTRDRSGGGLPSSNNA
ncbi:MAG TPA: efflux RND transporter permease subunit [Syntrophales bacterium]|nr:efflux RND transporter permease subunit [Syntrophales bacterium]